MRWVYYESKTKLEDTAYLGLQKTRLTFHLATKALFYSWNWNSTLKLSSILLIIYLHVKTHVFLFKFIISFSAHHVTWYCSILSDHYYKVQVQRTFLCFVLNICIGRTPKHNHSKQTPLVREEDASIPNRMGPSPGKSTSQLRCSSMKKQAKHYFNKKF